MWPRTHRMSAEVAKKAGADVEDRQSLEESVSADVKLCDQQFVAFALGQNLFDAADANAIGVDHSPAEEQFQLHLIL